MIQQTKKVDCSKEITVYVAKDGTEFSCEANCEQYEQSASCAYKTRLSNCLTKIEVRGVLDYILDGERGEGTYYKFTPQTEIDIINFIAYVNTQAYGEISSYTLCVPPSKIQIGKRYLVLVPCDSTLHLVFDETLAETYLKAFNQMFEEVVSDSTSNVKNPNS
jgi:hypothetical protein